MRSWRRFRALLDEARAADALRRDVMRQARAASGAGDEMTDELRLAVTRWKAWFGRRDELAALVLPRVARWEWSTGRRHSPLPLYFQRYPGRGRLLKTAPRPRAQHTESGLDADGRLLAMRVFDYRDSAFETFVLHDDAVTDIVQYSPGPRIPLEHGRIERQDGRVVHYESFRLNGYTPKMGKMGREADRLVEWLGPTGRFFLAEDYRYDGSLLREIATYGEAPGLGGHRYVDRVAYDPTGRVAAIDRIWDAAPAQAVYRRRRRGQSLDDLRAAAVAELVPAVIEVVSRTAGADAVYCVELSYQAVGQYFPPLITLGLERQRVNLPEPDLAFRPMLSGGRTAELPSPDRLEACRQFDQEVLSAQQWALGTRMLREAAAELTRHDWTGDVTVTDDFVAYAVDPEADDLDEALAASAPPERLAGWKARGWL